MNLNFPKTMVFLNDLYSVVAVVNIPFCESNLQIRKTGRQSSSTISLKIQVVVVIKLERSKAKGSNCMLL